MGLLTKAEVRTAVRQAIDDPSSKQWSDANLDVLISNVGDTMWMAVLDTFPYALSANESETTDASGVIDLDTGLTTPGRWYAIQRVLNSGAEVQPIFFKEKVPQGGYYLLGSNLVTDPVLATTALDIDYAYLPTKFNDLSTDATVLDGFPEGHESALIYLAAAASMTKGDRESMTQIGRLADHAIEAFLTHIASRYPAGLLPRVRQVKSAILENYLVTPDETRR